MRRFVLDASVILRALIEDEGSAAGHVQAVTLWELAGIGQVDVRQPPHWLAEIAGVLARRAPDTAADDMRLLHAMDFPTVGDAETYALATDLAIELEQHVFDTLYHAVAISVEDGVLVTADRRYYGKAWHLGRIAYLADLDLSS